MTTDGTTDGDAATSAEPPNDDPWGSVPSAPMSVGETGIPEPFLRELLLKTIWAHDRPTQGAMSHALGVHVRVIEELVDNLNREEMVEVDRSAAQTGVQFRYRLTERGRAAAHDALARSRYVGIAPVPVSAYNTMIAKQVEQFKRPPLTDIERALTHLVLPRRLIEVLGQAFFSRRALMIYGPSGNGKTDIVTSVAHVVAGSVIIPFALYTHGQLVRVFEPDIHKSLVDKEEESEGVLTDSSVRRDRRWLPVHRPIVIVGGDMGAEALEMSYDATMGVHNAPLSVVAQGGVLVIDDLGRQRISPKEILNRWVIMMEQGYDSFALGTSEIVRLPLDVTLVFSTNMTLQELMDESFLRRIAYKVAVPDPSSEELAEITRRFCTRVNIDWSEDAIQYMIEQLYQPGLPTPRGCYPRDIITTVIDEAEFNGRKPALNKDSVDTALTLYLGIGDVLDSEAA
jgi:predicted ATPase with chaperone activity